MHADNGIVENNGNLESMKIMLDDDEALEGVEAWLERPSAN